MRYIKVGAKVNDRIDELNQSWKTGKGTTFCIKARDTEDPDSSYDGRDDFCEDEVSMNLSEQDMRIVFCGLVKGAKKRFC